MAALLLTHSVLQTCGGSGLCCLLQAAQAARRKAQALRELPERALLQQGLRKGALAAAPPAVCSTGCNESGSSRASSHQAVSTIFLSLTSMRFCTLVFRGAGCGVLWPEFILSCLSAEARSKVILYTLVWRAMFFSYV